MIIQEAIARYRCLPTPCGELSARQAFSLVKANARMYDNTARLSEALGKNGISCDPEILGGKPEIAGTPSQSDRKQN